MLVLIVCLVWAVLERLGGHWPSWSYLGPSGNYLGAALGPSWAVLGPSEGPLGLSWGGLGGPGGHLGASETPQRRCREKKHKK